MPWNTLIVRRNGRPANRGMYRIAKGISPRLERLEELTLLSGGFSGHSGFGIDGTVTTPFRGDLNDGASQVLVEPTGEIVAVGSAGNNLALAEYTPDGELRKAFGHDGKVVAQFPGEFAYPTGAALQADGKILVAGVAYSPTGAGSHTFLARYTTTWRLDGTFGNAGRVDILASTGGSGGVIAVQPDGEIFVAGTLSDYSTPPSATWVVERYTASGTLDGGFGTGGVATTKIGPYGGVLWVGFQGEEIVVAGSSSDGTTVSAALARYTAEGKLDSKFGTSGIATTAIGQNVGANGAAVQSDGKIVVAGNSATFDPTYVNSAFVARYTVNGTLDPGFGTGGIATTTVPENGYVSGVAVQADGKVVLGGGTGARFSQVAVVRLTAAGIPDTNFGNGGTVVGSVASPEYANAIAIQGDGKIVVTGSGFVPATGNNFATMRFTATGAVDAQFGDGGGVTTNFVGRVTALANSVVEDGDGNLLVAGATTSGGSSLGVARYRDNGRLDTSFGKGGKVQVTFNPYIFGPRSRDGFVAVQADGKILLVGTSIEPGTTNYDFVMARLLPDGRLDPGFGTGGKVTTFSGGKSTDLAPSGGVVIQPDGKILVAGYLENYGAFPYVDRGLVVRYNADGSLDTAFGSGGRSLIVLPQDSNRVKSLALGPDGKILVGGYVTDPATFTQTYFLERLDADGLPDGSFGKGGQIITDFTGSFGAGGPMAIRPDGSIVVGGTTRDAASQTFFTLAQFTANGATDTSFGTDGKARVGFGGDPDTDSSSLSNLALQHDGKVVVVGTTTQFDPTTFTSTSQFALARFTASGRLDRTFGSRGIVTTSINDHDSARAVLIREDGRIVVVGTSRDPAQFYTDFALAEYNPDGSLVHGRKRKH